MGKFYEELNDAIVALTNKPSLQFFGIVTYGRTKIVEKGDKNSPSIAWTDGKNIYLLENEEVTKKNIIALIIHEYYHIISQHIERGKNKKFALWAIAIDHATNEFILKMKDDFVKLPESHIYFPEYEGMSAERVYEKLDTNTEQITINIEGNDENREGNNNSENGSSEDGKMSAGNGKYEVEVTTLPNGRKMVTITSEEKKMSGAIEGKQIEGAGDELIETSRIYSSLDRGIQEGGCIENIRDIIRIKVSPKDLLEMAIQYHVGDKTVSTWNRRNNYIRPPKFPRLTSRIDDDTVNALTVSIDTSGSMSTEDLKCALGLIIEVCGYFKKLYIFMHDVYVTDSEVYNEPPDKNTILERFSKIKGRGGTSHLQLFNTIEKIIDKEEIGVSLNIFFTDFCSDVENIWKDFSFIRDFPSIWVVNNNVKIDLPGTMYKVINYTT